MGEEPGCRGLNIL